MSWVDTIGFFRRAPLGSGWYWADFDTKSGSWYFLHGPFNSKEDADRFVRELWVRVNSEGAETRSGRLEHR